jgi:hypothetical protein
MTNSIEGAMPPLPEADYVCGAEGDGYSADRLVHWMPAYTEDQMHAYAKAYAAPLIARVAELQAERAKLREAIDEAAFEYSRYIVEDTAHTTLSLYMMEAFDAALTSNKEQQP